MGLGKTYSADYLIDSNGNTGVSGQVLISTATGIDWADGSAITGGPFLPLAGGTMTGNSGVLMPDSFELKLGTGNDAQIKHDGAHLFIDNGVGNTYLRNTSTGSILLRNSTGGDIQFDNEFAGNILFNTSNIERMRIDSAGNVGIGATSVPSEANLSLGAKTTTEGGHLVINKATSSTHATHIDNNTDTFRIMKGTDSASGSVQFILNHTNGNVGIGTTSPQRNLTIYESSGNAVLQLANNTSGVGASDGFLAYTDGVNVGLENKENGYLSLATNATEKMRITATGNVGIGVVPKTGGSTWQHIQFGGTGNIISRISDSTVDAMFANNYYINSSNTDTHIVTGAATRMFLNDGEIKFDTAPSAAADAVATFTNRLFIANTGNVGIGTTSPSSKLQVSGDAYVTEQFGQGVAIANKIAAYGGEFRASGASAQIFFGRSGSSVGSGAIGADSTYVFRVWTTPGFGNPFVIKQDGNVGIGTTSPTATLDVVGNTRLGSGTLHVSTDQTFGTGFTYSFRDAVGILNPNGTSAASATAVMSIGGMSNGYSLVTTGNVGIGTASPTHKLHVNGDMRLTGALRDSNNAKGSAGQVLSSTGSATDWIPLPATPTIYTPKVYNLNNSTNINSQGQKLVPDFGTLEIEGNTTVQQVSGSDTDFQVTDENTGIYEVTYAVFYKNTGNQRTPLGTYLTLNGTAVNGSLMVNYVRSNVAGGGNFSSCTNTFYVNVTDASHPMALCVRRADSSTAPSGISMVEPAGMAVKSTISFRRIS